MTSDLLRNFLLARGGINRYTNQIRVSSAKNDTMFQPATKRVVTRGSAHWSTTPVSAGARSLQHRSIRRMLELRTVGGRIRDLKIEANK